VTIDTYALNRRHLLKTIGAMAGTATAIGLIPLTGRALAATQPSAIAFASPPDAAVIDGSSQLAQDYSLALQKVLDESNPIVPQPLFALNAQTRQGMKIGNASQNYLAPAYLDGTVSDSPDVPVVGPTLEFVRGTTNGVWFRNTLTVCGPTNDMLMSNPYSMYNPHGYTTTNLHTHGLHVTPQPPSDDVLLMIESSADTFGDDVMSEYPYQYILPGDHPVGTFWYHPHKHGAVASQVGPGMAGALLVRNDSDTPDFEDLIAAAPYNITRADERVMVLQSLSYYHDTTSARDIFYPDGYYKGTAQSEGDQITVAQCYGSNENQAAVLEYPTSQPTTSVNGVVVPEITMDKGQILRLRMINATNGQAYVPKIVPADGTSAAVPTVYAIATDGIALPVPFNYAAFSDTDKAAPYFEIDYAVTTTSDPVQYWTTGEILTLAPGQRVDLLIEAKDAGSFTLKGAAEGEAPMVVQAGAEGDFKVLNTDDIALITVSDTQSAKAQSVPPMSLFADPGINRPEMPEVGFLKNNTTPTSLPPTTQTMEFKTDNQGFGVNEPSFKINDQHFDSSLPDAQLQLYLNDTDVWNLYSTNDTHIFHIHINSFLAFARAEYDAATRAYLSPVFYSTPVWRDTIYFDSGTSGETYVPGTTVMFASKQVDFTGEFVLHCHNLFHEDAGMMLTVSILDPATGKKDPQ